MPMTLLCGICKKQNITFFAMAKIYNTSTSICIKIYNLGLGFTVKLLQHYWYIRLTTCLFHGLYCFKLFDDRWKRVGDDSKNNENGKQENQNSWHDQFYVSQCDTSVLIISYLGSSISLDFCCRRSRGAVYL